MYAFGSLYTDHKRWHKSYLIRPVREDGIKNQSHRPINTSKPLEASGSNEMKCSNLLKLRRFWSSLKGEAAVFGSENIVKRILYFEFLEHGAKATYNH